MFKIDKGIPIPRKGTTKYPWREMEVGDSFLVPYADGIANWELQNKLVSSSLYYKPKKFKTSMIDGGVRCWRIV